MAKIVIPQTSPFLKNVQSPRLTTLPTTEETYANLIAGISDGLVKFSLEERKREDELKLTENPIKKSVAESFEENLNSYVYDDNGSIDYEQSLIKSENILNSSDILYKKTQADVVRRYEDMGLSQGVLNAVRSSITGQFNEDAKSIKQAILQQQSALKIGYIDELKLDFTEDADANIEISFEKIQNLIDSIAIKKDKSSQRAEFIQFARSAIQEKTGTLGGALQIINGFELDPLNKAVTDVRGVLYSFNTLRLELNGGVNSQEVPDNEKEWIPVDDDVLEIVKLFALNLPDNHPNKKRTVALVNMFQDNINRQGTLENINALVQEGKILEAIEEGKGTSPSVLGSYFGKLLDHVNPADPNDIGAFSKVINFFTDFSRRLPKDIKQNVEDFILLQSFPTESQQILFTSLYQKRGRLNLSKDATDVLERWSGSFESNGQPALNPASDKMTRSKTASSTGNSGVVGKGYTDEGTTEVMRNMGKENLGDSWLGGWLGTEDTFKTDHVIVKNVLNASYQDHLAQGLSESEALANARNDFERDNLFVTINGKVRLLRNFSIQNLIDSSGNPVPVEDFSVILEEKLYDALSRNSGATDESIQEQMDKLVKSEFFIEADQNRQLIFFTNNSNNRTYVTIDANKIAKDFATNANFVNTKDLLTLFAENPESLTTNAGQALQTPMPSSQKQVRQANSYLGYTKRKPRKPGDPIFGEEDLKYHVDNYPFKVEDPGFLEFIEGLDPLVQIEVLRAKVKIIIGMSTGNKYITHPYTRGLLQENFKAVLESFKHNDPADAVQKLVNARAEQGEQLGFWEERAALYSDLIEEAFDFVTEKTNFKYDDEDLSSMHKVITDWLKTGKPVQDLDVYHRNVFYGLSNMALEMTKESYQLTVNSLKTNEERIAFFEENIRKPIEIDNYMFSGVEVPANAILIMNGKSIYYNRSGWGSTDSQSKPKEKVEVNKKAIEVQRAFNMMKKTMAENPRGVADRYFVSDDLNIFLGADSYLRTADLKPSARAMVSGQLIPYSLKGRSILSYINEENPSLDENQIVDLLRFNLAEYFTGIEVDPEYAFAFDKGSILKILNSLRSNDE